MNGYGKFIFEDNTYIEGKFENNEVTNQNLLIFY